MTALLLSKSVSKEEKRMASTKAFQKVQNLVINELEKTAPNRMRHISDVSIGFSTDNAKGITNPAFKVGPSAMQHAIYASCDSVGVKRPYWANDRKQFTRFDISPSVVQAVQDSIAAGKDPSTVADTYMSFDSETGQLVFKAVPKGTKDALVTGLAIPSWNIGYMQKIFKQPYYKSFAKNLVSVEGFGNQWADVVGVFKETFEGNARTNAAQSTFEANASDPISNKSGLIVSNIFNIAVDYEIGNEEQARSGNAGDFLTGQLIADRPKYADMVINRLQDVIRYFGVPEADVIGLTGVNAIDDYSGDSFASIMAGSSTTKGAEIIQALYAIIGDFLQDMSYMPTELKINCSTTVFRALTTTLYSDSFNPASPISIISENMIGGVSPAIDGVKQCKYSITADAMLDADSPYNTVGEGDDLFIITAPSIGSALEDQTGLVISPEPLSRFIVPPMYQRSGYLYTMYTRMGGLITPIKAAVKVYKGIGVQG
jgi:hypothetical protein